MTRSRYHVIEASPDSPYVRSVLRSDDYNAAFDACQAAVDNGATEAKIIDTESESVVVTTRPGDAPEPLDIPAISRAYYPESYTSDPARVTEVCWSIASERVADYAPDTDELIDGPHDTARMQHALDQLARHAITEYPNAATIHIVDGGFDNQFCSFGPRAETDDGSVYEPFYDDMSRWEDEAIAAALNRFP